MLETATRIYACWKCHRIYGCLKHHPRYMTAWNITQDIWHYHSILFCTYASFKRLHWCIHTWNFITHVWCLFHYWHMPSTDEFYLKQQHGYSFLWNFITHVCLFKALTWNITTWLCLRVTSPKMSAYFKTSLLAYAYLKHNHRHIYIWSITTDICLL